MLHELENRQAHTRAGEPGGIKDSARRRQLNIVGSDECPDQFNKQIKMTDPIADYLTRLRNAIHAGHRVVEVPASNLKKEITKILFDQGYILNYKFIDGVNTQGVIKIALKYDPVDRVNAIKGLKRVSRPGLRQYTGYKDMPRVLNGLGIAILSTSKGVMTNKKAAEEKIGGEVLCYVY